LARSDINAGEDWRTEISEHLEAADLILLLVSAYFLDSDYCFDIEMKRALERHTEGSTAIVPIALRPADWSTLPIAGFQGLPTDLRPVTSWPDRHAAWADVAAGLRRLIERTVGPTLQAEREVKAEPERSAPPALDDARYWYRKAAEGGDLQAAYNLGVLLHEDGDLEEAANFYRQAADGGRADAMNNLGLLLIQQGSLGAGKRMLRNAMRAGSTDAVTNLGVELINEGDVEEAEQLLTPFAGEGDAQAAGTLAVLYHQNGRPDDARRWYEVASHAGNPVAMANFGAFLLDHGKPAEAESVLRRGAATGNLEARFNLGVVLESQEKFPKPPRATVSPRSKAISVQPTTSA
jgi:TPR repeat protein